MQPIDSGLNRAIMTMARLSFPNGFDVSSKLGEFDSDSFGSLRRHVAQTGRMVVWPGESDRTIYADPAVNWTFRAWHDANHLAHGFDFSLSGEAATVESQIAELRLVFPRMPERWAQILRCEVVGQAEHFERFGEFVTDQVAFTLAQLGV